MSKKELKKVIKEAIRTMPLVDFCKAIGIDLSPAQKLMLKSFEVRAHLRGHLCEQKQQSKVRQLISLN